MFQEKYAMTPEQIVFSVIFSLISSCVSGLVYFACIIMLGFIFSPELDFTQISMSLVVSYLLISVLGVFISLVVKMVFLKLTGYKYEDVPIVGEVVSLLFLLVFAFVLSIPLFLYIYGQLHVSFPVTVLGLYATFNFISVIYLSRDRDEFASALISMYIAVFLFLILNSVLASDATFFLLGVFLFPVLFLGVTEIFVGIINFFKIFFYRVYGTGTGRK